MRVNANVLLREPKSGAVTVVNAGEEVPEWAERLIGDHLVDSTEPEADGYGALTVADLRGEIEQRNEGREEADLIPSDGKKADLIAALEADDDN
ncbi:MAG: SAP domain-containing protein [Actinomycetaceae bacterium]